MKSFFKIIAILFLIYNTIYSLYAPTSPAPFQEIITLPAEDTTRTCIQDYFTIAQDLARQYHCPQENLTLICQLLEQNPALITSSLIDTAFEEIAACLEHHTQGAMSDPIAYVISNKEHVHKQLLTFIGADLPTKAKTVVNLTVINQVSSGKLYVGGDTTINHNLTVNNNETVRGDILINGDTIIEGNAHIQGNTTFGGNVLLPNPDITGSLNLTGSPEQACIIFKNNNSQEKARICSSSVAGNKGMFVSVDGGATQNFSVNNEGGTILQPLSGSALTVTGNTTNIAAIISGAGTAGALKLIGNPPSVLGDDIVTIDPLTGMIRQGPAGVVSGAIINGGQSGPLTIGTTNATSLTIITNGANNNRLSIDPQGTVSIANLATIGGGLDVLGTATFHALVYQLANTISPNNILYVQKGPITSPNQFNTITDALAAITGNSASNRFEIRVAPGIYSEPTLTMKAYVSLIGESQEACIIQASATNQNIIVGAANSAIKQLTLSGATGSGFAAILHTVSGEMHVWNCIFDSSDILINQTAAAMGSFIILVDAQILPTSIFTTAFKISPAVSGMPAGTIVNGLLWAPLASKNITDFVNITGPGAFFNAANCSIGSLFVRVGATFLNISNGASVRSATASFAGFDTGISVPVGVAPGPSVTVWAAASNNNTLDINIQNPFTKGAIGGSFDVAGGKVIINPLVTNLEFLATSPIAGGITLLGPIFTSTLIANLTNISPLINNEPAIGVLAGGTITGMSTSFTVTVAAGSGYLMTGLAPEDHLQYTTWQQQSLVITGSNTDNFMYVDSNGIVQSALSEPSIINTIELGKVRTGTTGILFVQNTPHNVRHLPTFSNEMIEEAFGPIYTTGSIVTQSGNLQLNASSGIYFYGSKEFTPMGSNPLIWRTFLGAEANLYIGNQTNIDYQNYDNGGTLTPIPLGQFAKHELYIINGPQETYALVYSQTVFSSLNAATLGANPTPPATWTENICPIASIIVTNTTVPAAAIQQILDERPRVGFSAASVAGVSVHGNLLGLLVDDHPQYLLVNGTRAMSGSLNMGTNAIANASTITANGIVTAGGANITGATNINISGAAATMIGNNSSTNTITGATNINTTGSATTTIGNNLGPSTTAIAGAFTVANGETITAGGLTISAGGASIAGGIAATSGNVSAASGNILGNSLTVTTTATICNLNVTCGATLTGATFGNLIVTGTTTTGKLDSLSSVNAATTITAGTGLTVTNGGANITGTTNINTSGTAATNIGNSATANTLQGITRNIGQTLLSATSDVVLTVTGNNANPSTILVGSSSTTAPAIRLINNPVSVSTDSLLTIDALGNVKQGTTIFGNVIYNGGQTGPLTIGTTDATTTSFITNNIQRIGIDNSTGIVTIANGETITTGGLTINSGGASIAGGITATSGNITASTGNINATAGSLSAGTTVTAGTGITATTGNIVASSGNISASGTVTGGTGVIATTGNVAAPAGSVTASAAISAGTTVTAGTGLNVTSGGANITGNSTVTGDAVGATSALTINQNNSSTTGSGLNIIGAANPTGAPLTITSVGANQNSITASAGTVTLPTYSFTGNTNAGLYAPATNQLALVTSSTGRLIIDGTGSVSSFSQYRAHAYKSSTQTITNTTGTIVFNTAMFDPNNNFNTGTGIYTAPISGYYWVASNVTFTSNTNVGNGATRSFNFVKNGTAITGYSTSTSGWTVTGTLGLITTTGLGPYTLQSTGLVQLNGGDTLRVDYTNANGGGVTDTISTNDTHLSIHFMSTV